ncbi:MAG: HDIG domain-containing protein [Candidatus Actinomarina sp.]|nr:HDIG domain-containing protein [Candidatus Actinomarina sp.]
MNKYILHLKKITYILIFSSAVWFISFTIFPENQVIKLEIGDKSPTTFSAPRYLTVIDKDKTNSLKDDAINNVAPVYSIDTSVATDVIDGITEMFLTVIKSRTEEILEQSDEEGLEQSEPNLIIIELTKSEQIQNIRSSLLFSTISTSAIEVLVEISNTDKNNDTNFLTQIEFEAKNKANEFLSKGVSNENLNQQRQSIVSNSPTLNLPSELYAIVPEARISSTVGEIIAENLIANQKLEEELWNQQKDKAAEAVENVTIQFFKDEIIVSEGEVINEIIFEALNELGFLSGESRTVQTAAIPIIFAVFLVLYILLWRLRDAIWANDNELLLMLTLILISSIFLRGVSYFSQLSDLEFIQYSLPISFVGILSVTLLNLRATLILSLSSSLLALAGGGSVGLVALGALGTIIPAIFLSEETDRLLLRERIVYISLTQPLLAFGVYFFLRDDGNLTQILIFSFLISLVANLAALSLTSYIESIFRLTSGFKLSELADRNHPALRHLEDKALGTFNHSLVVGTLADRAANKIGANSQLARAMAYYHDLGKTMNPTMFVENQIGYTNPHDRLLPSESANIIKNHVTDGVKLAKKFKIPEIVYQGIIEHHGNAVLRYFYEKEKLVNPSVSKEEFRHLGQKPTSKESAILMLADSLEAASRAIFMNEDADEKKISNVIEEIFNEKISDGQLSNAPITFKELNTIKESFQVSLEGLYHQRVLYPEITEEE